MSHHLQKYKQQNYELIKKLIAKSMPKGSKNKPLRAVLATYGISHALINQMLEDLLNSGKVEFDEESGVWSLPIIKIEEEEGETE
jgi:DNA-binding transcriptional MocR family regulator